MEILLTSLLLQKKKNHHQCFYDIMIFGTPGLKVQCASEFVAG